MSRSSCPSTSLCSAELLWKRPAVRRVISAAWSRGGSCPACIASTSPFLVKYLRRGRAEGLMRSPTASGSASCGAGRQERWGQEA